MAATVVPLLAAAADPTCPLFRPGAERIPAGDCNSCHGLRSTHPVDFDYAAAAAHSRGSLRTPQEVIRRGVVLPDGQVKCVTCHDPNSPWKYKIALPPGARPSAAVNPRDRRTYDALGGPARVTDGEAVTPTPLCSACHAFGN